MQMHWLLETVDSRSQKNALYI